LVRDLVFMGLIEHFRCDPRIIFYYLGLIITIVIFITPCVLVILIAAAFFALGWNDNAAVLETCISFELVNLDRVEVVECVFP